MAEINRNLKYNLGKNSFSYILLSFCIVYHIPASPKGELSVTDYTLIEVKAQFENAIVTSLYKWLCISTKAQHVHLRNGNIFLKDLFISFPILDLFLPCYI